MILNMAKRIFADVGRVVCCDGSVRRRPLNFPAVMRSDIESYYKINLERSAFWAKTPTVALTESGVTV